MICCVVEKVFMDYTVKNMLNFAKKIKNLVEVSTNNPATSSEILGILYLFNFDEIKNGVHYLFTV